MGELIELPARDVTPLDERRVSGLVMMMVNGTIEDLRRAGTELERRKEEKDLDKEMAIAIKESRTAMQQALDFLLSPYRSETEVFADLICF